MVEYEHSNLYNEDSVDKQLIIEYDGGTITNELLHQENFSLTESLCSEDELTFGCCEASIVKFRVSNIISPLKGKWLTIKETLGGNTDSPFSLGKYKVETDTPTADRSWRDITAYDAMYDIINADVADWYNEILPTDDSTCTLKEFRGSFATHFGLTQADVELVNDSMTITKTISITATSETGVSSTVGEAMSGKEVLSAICEINGCFAHINRSGELTYIYLTEGIQGLYPRDDLYPADDLYPIDDSLTNYIKKSYYTDCTYDDYITSAISKLQIRQEENDIGVVIGDGDNCYVIEDNFLVYGKGTSELKTIAQNVYNAIDGIRYRPFECTAKGNPCREVGDAIRLNTKLEIIESYILQRTLDGIQALTDTYAAEGVEECSEQVNSVQTSIKQIKGKANILTRTIEETNSHIDDVEEGLETTITQTATDIRTEVSDTKKALETTITQTASNIVLKVDSNGSIVEAALSADADTGTEFKVTADNVSFSANDVINMMAGGTINLKSKKINITSDKFSVTSEGVIKAVDGEFSGKLTTTSGEIGGFTIGSSAIYNGKSSYSSTTEGLYLGTDGISLGTSSNYFKVSKSGTLTANNATISGTISGSTISGGTISGATINGSTLYSESAARYLSINSGNIEGGRTDSGYAGNLNFGGRIDSQNSVMLNSDYCIALCAPKLATADSANPSTVYVGQDTSTPQFMYGFEVSWSYTTVLTSLSGTTTDIATPSFRWNNKSLTFTNGLMTST